MARFRYKRGEKPLDGFTIEHGLGVGGFGEVYYAVSDSGREVALKAVQNYEEIELRGIRHCMNLKSPHLVSIFDVKFNEEEIPFVIMEYVQGPSLRDLLDASPEGLGPTKAAFFLREMAKGLSYLHDAGVVHRDLKPHNVFYEDGYVKIGDYSLCKMISSSHRTGHTMTVGTVHYMAPEISMGRYDASVDIYALGIMLYEMLTGLPPYAGDSIGEVLMKHMTEEPDLSKVEEPFRSVIAKAIAKNPDDRYQNAAEMVEAIFGVDHVQNSVVEFNPAELTLVADRVAKRVLTTPSGRPASSRPGGASWGKSWKPSDAGPATSDAAAGNRTGANGPPPVQPGAGYPNQHPSPNPRQDPNPAQNLASLDAMPWQLRYGLAGGVCIVSGWLLAGQMLGGSPSGLVTIGFAVAAVVLHKHLRARHPQKRNSKLWLFGTVFVSMWLMGGGHPGMSRWLTSLSIALPFAFLNWDQFLHPQRKSRLQVWPLVACFFVPFAVCIFAGQGFGRSAPFDLSIAMLLGTISTAIGLCLQIVSPWVRQQPMAANFVGPGAEDPHVATQAYNHEMHGQHAMPVNEYSAVPFAAKATSPVEDTLKQVATTVSGVAGYKLFTASSILAVLSITSSFPGFHLLEGEVCKILSAVGFGLVLGAMAFFVASGKRRGPAFLRMLAAVGILAGLHVSVLSDWLDPNYAMVLPLAIVLLAWPDKQVSGHSTQEQFK